MVTAKVKQADGTWLTLGVGPQGPAGANGTSGVDGKTVLNGVSDPSSGTGNNGDFYINTTTNKLFGPKAGGSWPAGIVLGAAGGATTLGKSAVGASWESINTVTSYMKKITVSAAGILTGVSLHIRSTGDFVAGIPTALLYADNAGAPGALIGVSAIGLTDTYIPRDVGSGTAAARWISVPISRWVTPGDYWIGFWNLDVTSLEIAYDTGGTDKTMTSGQNWIPEGGRYSTTNSTKDYSIKADVVVPLGPSGPAGSKGVIFQIPGPVVTSTGSLRIYNDSGATKTISAIRATLVTPGTTATTIDANKNGTTLFTTQANRPSLGSGVVTQKVTNMDVTSWANGEYLTVDVDAAGTGADGLIIQVES